LQVLKHNDRRMMIIVKRDDVMSKLKKIRYT
jgi:hypothetical protein